VPVAVNCWVAVGATDVDPGVTEIEVSCGGVGVDILFPLLPPQAVQVAHINSINSTVANEEHVGMCVHFDVNFMVLSLQMLAGLQNRNEFVP
jgi:hypothetical protein